MFNLKIIIFNKLIINIIELTQFLFTDYYSTYLAGKINNMLNSVKSIAQVPSSPFGFK